MEDIVNLCKHRGFIFPSSEIYSPFSGFFDYGPLGTELKRNIKGLWWKEFVQRREDVVGLDCSVIANPAMWHASGHVAGFSDPMVDCRESGLRFRADQVLWAKLQPEVGDAVYVSILEADEADGAETATAEERALKAAKKRAKAAGVEGPFLPLGPLQDLTQCQDDEEYSRIPSPASGGSGGAGALTKPREFNLMFQTNVGAVAGDASAAYLRPETAQGIFTNFANVQRTARKKIPFGIAQIGKAFRNEITPRNFVFRSREFELMEIEYFVGDGDDEWRGHYDAWLADSLAWLQTVGLPRDKLHLDVKEGGSLAHYARACTDITFDFPFGRQELMGVAARGDYDLRTHSEASGEKLEYLDDSTPGATRKFIPHCIEPSIGVDRLLLALLTSAYRVEEVLGAKGKVETRTVLGLHPHVAPIKVAVFPLAKNNVELSGMARQLYKLIQERYTCEYDTAGAIGRRYRRADEVGTPFCITVDFDSMDDHSVTVRHRDSMRQERIHVDELMPFLARQLD